MPFNQEGLKDRVERFATEEVTQDDGRAVVTFHVRKGELAFTHEVRRSVEALLAPVKTAHPNKKIVTRDGAPKHNDNKEWSEVVLDRAHDVMLDNLLPGAHMFPTSVLHLRDGDRLKETYTGQILEQDLMDLADDMKCRVEVAGKYRDIQKPPAEAKTLDFVRFALQAPKGLISPRIIEALFMPQTATHQFKGVYDERDFEDVNPPNIDVACGDFAIMVVWKKPPTTDKSSAEEPYIFTSAEPIVITSKHGLRGKPPSVEEIVPIFDYILAETTNFGRQRGQQAKEFTFEWPNRSDIRVEILKLVPKKTGLGGDALQELF